MEEVVNPGRSPLGRGGGGGGGGLSSLFDLSSPSFVEVVLLDRTATLWAAVLGTNGADPSVSSRQGVAPGSPAVCIFSFTHTLKQRKQELAGS